MLVTSYVIQHYFVENEAGSSISKPKIYETGDRGLIPDRRKIDFSCPVLRGSGAHSTVYPVNTGSSFLGAKQREREACYSPWSRTSDPRRQ